MSRSLSNHRHRPSISRLALAVVLAAGLSSGARAETEGEEIGRAAFEQNCAACHGPNPVPRALNRDQLAALSPEHIYRVITEGIMIIQAATLNEIQRKALAVYLSAEAWGGEPAELPDEILAKCENNPPIADDVLNKPHWNGWGIDLDNTHFQPGDHARLSRADLAKLELRWAFGFPGATTIGSQPAVIGKRLLVGSPTKGFYALHAETGCAYWKTETEGPVRAAPTVARLGDRWVVYIGDRAGFLYQLDAHTGELLWKTRADPHPASLITASPVLYEDHLYVATASIEELHGGNMQYECCTFRGSVLSIAPASGEIEWQTYVIPEEPKPTRKTKRGTQLYAPSGAGIWSAPTIDPKRGVLYVTTGDSYSAPAADTSDAVIAINLDGGGIRWAKQTTAGDVFTAACAAGGADPEIVAECGPDLDFGAAPILRTLADGRQLLFAGQKSGVMHALDPDANGEIVWQKKLSPGGVLGGIEWGFAADRERLYVPISDVWETGSQPGSAGGLYSVDMKTGDVLWHTEAEAPDSCLERAGCNAGQPAAATLIPGVLFSSAMDGHIRAYAPESGEKLWDYDSNRSFETVNGVEAHGGSVNGPGVTVVDGWVYVGTGYGLFGMPGNALLAFGPP